MFSYLSAGLHTEHMSEFNKVSFNKFYAYRSIQINSQITPQYEWITSSPLSAPSTPSTGSKVLHTKREVASLAAKVFDPIGLIIPFTGRAKLLLQSLWAQGLGWDKAMPLETSRKWIQWVEELLHLKQLIVQRCYTHWPLTEHF